MVSDYRLGPYNPVTQLHCSERIDGDRHPQKADYQLEAMINQDAHGSGDRHRSFPGGIYMGDLSGPLSVEVYFCHPREFPFILSFFQGVEINSIYNDRLGAHLGGFIMIISTTQICDAELI